MCLPSVANCWAEVLGKFSRVKHIVLETCGAIASLGFLPGCEKLEGIGFFETNVQDGNIGQLLQLPVLSFVGMNDKQTIPTQNPKSIGN